MSYKDIFKDITSDSYSDIYVLYGREKYLFEMIISKINEGFEGNSFKDFNYQVIDSQEMSADDIMDNFEILPFMADRRFVVVKNAQFFNPTKNNLTEAQEKRLLSYFENPSKQTVVIFQCGVSIDKRKKLYKSVSKIGKVVELNKLEGSDLSKWLQKQAKESGKTFENSAVNLFISNIGYQNKNSNKTIYDLKNELLKLVAYVGDRDNIETSDVNSMLAKTLELNVFELVEHMANSNPLLAIKMTDELLISGESEFMILSMIGRHFRLLKKVKCYLEAGYSPSSIASKIKLHPFVCKKYASQSSGFSHRLLTEVINSVVETDYKIKTGRGNARIELEKLIAGFRV